MDHSRINISEEFLLLGKGIILLTRQLLKAKVHYALINQLLRSGTSAGANYEEACGAESRADFVHKLHITYKELRETNYWLRLIRKTELAQEHEVESLLEKSEMLIRIVGKSILTSKMKMKDTG